MSVLVLRFYALKLIFKLISIADCATSFELVRRRKNSRVAIFTARRKYSLGQFSSVSTYVVFVFSPFHPFSVEYEVQLELSLIHI